MNLFSILTDHTFRVVAAGAGILGLLCGVIGSFAVSRRRSLMGDGNSYACLSGVSVENFNNPRGCDEHYELI